MEWLHLNRIDLEEILLGESLNVPQTIPRRGDGSPIQSDSELGQFRSAGCVRMNQAEVKILWDFAPVGTAVVVLA